MTLYSGAYINPVQIKLPVCYTEVNIYNKAVMGPRVFMLFFFEVSTIITAKPYAVSDHILKNQFLHREKTQRKTNSL